MHCFRAWRRLAELALISVLASSVWAQGSNNAAKRPFTFEDLMALKRVAEPVVSPDGRFIACRYRDETSNLPKIAVIPFAGGVPTNILDIPIVDWQRVRWSSDSTSLTYIDTRSGVSNLWRQPLDGAPPRQLTAFNF